MKNLLAATTLIFLVTGIASSHVAAQTPRASETAEATGTPEATGTTPMSEPSTTPVPETVMAFLIRGEFLDEPTDFRLPGGQRATFADFHGSVTAMVDSVACITVNLKDDSSRTQEGKVLRVGEAGQPNACSQTNALITFVDEFGRTLLDQVRFKAGVTVELSLAVAPVIQTGETKGVSPPSTGSSPLLEQADESWPNRTTIIGAVIGALLGVVALALVSWRKGFSARR